MWGFLFSKVVPCISVVLKRKLGEFNISNYEKNGSWCLSSIWFLHCYWYHFAGDGAVLYLLSLAVILYFTNRQEGLNLGEYFGRWNRLFLPLLVSGGGEVCGCQVACTPEGRRESFAGRQASLMSRDSLISEVTTWKCFLTGVLPLFWYFWLFRLRLNILDFIGRHISYCMLHLFTWFWLY